MRPALLLISLVALTACGFDAGSMTGMPTGGDDGPGGGRDGCAAGHAGDACVLALADTAIATCAADDLDALRAELDGRADTGPVWSAGRALVRTDAPVAIAGTFNGWSLDDVSAPICNSDLVLAMLDVPSGFHTYKLVSDGGATWSLDAHNPAFAFDDFLGNVDGENSVLDTPDSGRGHLVRLGEECSSALGNCRDVTAYLPAGYDTASMTYPVLFVHDGKNVWDDHDCCFGHTGWELNVTLDAEIAAGRVAPVIVIAADQTANRNAEYGLSPATMQTFMEFQVGTLQPHALDKVRGNGQLFVAGSSLGGLVSMELALRYPETYAGAASLSGAFWPNMESGEALRDDVAAIGKQPLALYLDHGGNVATNSDGAADSVEVRDELMGLGWQRADSPSCTPGPDALCYFFEPGATHDELAWRARAWRFLAFLFPG